MILHCERMQADAKKKETKRKNGMIFIERTN